MTVSLPDGKSIANANQLSSTSSVVNGFLRAKLNQILHKNHAVDEFKSINHALDETTKVTQVRAKLIAELSGKTWHALAVDTDLEVLKAGTVNYLDASAIEGIQVLNKKLGGDNQISKISMAYYIDENSQLNRGYVVNDQVLRDKNDELVIDQMFHSWLISHNMASDDNGFIYRRTKDGVVTTQLVPADEIRGLLESPTTGLGTTIKKIDPDIELKLFWSAPEVAAEQVLDESFDSENVEPNVISQKEALNDLEHEADEQPTQTKGQKSQ